MRSHFFSRTIICGVVLASIVGCNGSGSNFPLGNLCPANYEPVAKTPSQKQKLFWRKSDSASNNQMPAGIYTFTRSDLIFKENAATRPITLHLFTDPKGTPVESCMRNGKPGTTGIAGKTDSISDMIVCPNGTKIIGSRRFEFGIDGKNRFKVDVNPLKVSQESDVFSDSKDGKDKINDAFLVQIAENSLFYEATSEVAIDRGTYRVKTQMRWSACPVTGCEACNGTPNL